MASTSTSKFPKIIAAVKEREEGLTTADTGLWRIGDALIAECGPPGKRGANDDSHKKLKAIAKELSELGFKDYSLAALRLYRHVAATFPHDKRLSCVPWSHHLEARDPETLDAAKAEAERLKHKFTVEFIKRFREARDRKDNDDGDTALRALNRALVSINEASESLKYLSPHLTKLKSEDRESLRAPVARLLVHANAVMGALGPDENIRQAAE